MPFFLVEFLTHNSVLGKRWLNIYFHELDLTISDLYEGNMFLWDVNNGFIFKNVQLFNNYGCIIAYYTALIWERVPLKYCTLQLSHRQVGPDQRVYTAVEAAASEESRC